MLKINSIILVGIFIFTITVSVNTAHSFNDFKALSDSIDILYDNQKYNEAFNLIEKNREKFPEYDFEMTELKANLYTDMGELEKALDVYEAGHKKGYFYLLHPAIEQYAPFKDMEKFGKLVEIDKKIRRKFNDNSKPEIEIQTPIDYSPDKSYPLLIVLHGGGSSNERAMKHWKSDKISSEYIIAFLQSHLHYTYNTHSWVTRDTTCVKNINKIYNDLIDDHTIDTNRVYIGGISAGGVFAVGVILNDIIPAKGVIGVCAKAPRGFDESTVDWNSLSGKKLYMFNGETDFYLDQAKDLVELIKFNNVDYQFYIIEGLGHDYPDDFPVWIDRALEYIDS